MRVGVGVVAVVRCRSRRRAASSRPRPRAAGTAIAGAGSTRRFEAGCRRARRRRVRSPTGATVPRGGRRRRRGRASAGDGRPPALEHRRFEQLRHEVGRPAGPATRAPGHHRGDHGHDGRERGDDRAASCPRTLVGAAAPPALSDRADRRVDRAVDDRPDHQRNPRRHALPHGLETPPTIQPDHRPPPPARRPPPGRRLAARRWRIAAPAGRGGRAGARGRRVRAAGQPRAAAPPATWCRPSTRTVAPPASAAWRGTTSSTASPRATPTRSRRPAVAVALRPRRRGSPRPGWVRWRSLGENLIVVPAGHQRLERRGHVDGLRARTEPTSSTAVSTASASAARSTVPVGSGWSRCSAPGSRPYLVLSGAGPRLTPDGDRARPARGPGRHFLLGPVPVTHAGW